MSSFFEQELRKLFADGAIIEDPKFVGRACLGNLGGDLRVRAEFITINMLGEYDALRLTVLNRTEGVVNRNDLLFKDIPGTKSVPNTPYRGTSPYIRNNNGKMEWCGYRPTPADFETLRQVADDYLDVFRERMPERTMDIPVKKSPGRKIPKKSRGER